MIFPADSENYIIRQPFQLISTVAFDWTPDTSGDKNKSLNFTPNQTAWFM